MKRIVTCNKGGASERLLSGCGGVGGQEYKGTCWKKHKNFNFLKSLTSLFLLPCLPRRALPPKSAPSSKEEGEVRWWGDLRGDFWCWGDLCGDFWGWGDDPLFRDLPSASSSWICHLSSSRFPPDLVFSSLFLDWPPRSSFALSCSSSFTLLGNWRISLFRLPSFFLTSHPSPAVEELLPVGPFSHLSFLPFSNSGLPFSTFLSISVLPLLSPVTRMAGASILLHVIPIRVLKMKTTNEFFSISTRTHCLITPSKIFLTNTKAIWLLRVLIEVKMQKRECSWRGEKKMQESGKNVQQPPFAAKQESGPLRKQALQLVFKQKPRE